MRDKETLHRRIQELCDCFATASPLKEMSVLKGDEDKEEAALKWVALAILHGIDQNAKKITLTNSKDGEVKVTAEYRDAELPSPGPEIGKRVIDSIRRITHLEEDKGKMPLAVGIRNGSIMMEVKLKRKDEGEHVTLKFPE